MDEGMTLGDRSMLAVAVRAAQLVLAVQGSEDQTVAVDYVLDEMIAHTWAWSYLQGIPTTQAVEQFSEVPGMDEQVVQLISGVLADLTALAERGILD